MNPASRSSFRAALTQAEADLKNHEAQGEALRNAVAALRKLLDDAPAQAAPKRKAAPRRRVSRRKDVATKSGEPALHVRTRAFAGLGPSKAMAKFVKEHGDDYAPTTVANALMAGGVKSTSRNAVLQGIYNFRRRAKAKAEAANEAAAAPATDTPAAD